MLNWSQLIQNNNSLQTTMKRNKPRNRSKSPSGDQKRTNRSRDNSRDKSRDKFVSPSQEKQSKQTNPQFELSNKHAKLIEMIVSSVLPQEESKKKSVVIKPQYELCITNPSGKKNFIFVKPTPILVEEPQQLGKRESQGRRGSKKLSESMSKSEKRERLKKLNESEVEQIKDIVEEASSFLEFPDDYGVDEIRKYLSDYIVIGEMPTSKNDVGKELLRDGKVLIALLEILTSYSVDEIAYKMSIFQLFSKHKIDTNYDYFWSRLKKHIRVFEEKTKKQAAESIEGEENTSEESESEDECEYGGDQLTLKWRPEKKKKHSKQSSEKSSALASSINWLPSPTKISQDQKQSSSEHKSQPQEEEDSGLQQQPLGSCYTYKSNMLRNGHTKLVQVRKSARLIQSKRNKIIKIQQQYLRSKHNTRKRIKKGQLILTEKDQLAVMTEEELKSKLKEFKKDQEKEIRKREELVELLREEYTNVDIINIKGGDEALEPLTYEDYEIRKIILNQERSVSEETIKDSEDQSVNQQPESAEVEKSQLVSNISATSSVRKSFQSGFKGDGTGHHPPSVSSSEIYSENYQKQIKINEEIQQEQERRRQEQGRQRSDNSLHRQSYRVAPSDSKYRANGEPAGQSSQMRKSVVYFDKENGTRFDESQMSPQGTKDLSAIPKSWEQEKKITMIEYQTPHKQTTSQPTQEYSKKSSQKSSKRKVHQSGGRKSPQQIDDLIAQQRKERKENGEERMYDRIEEEYYQAKKEIQERMKESEEKKRAKKAEEESQKRKERIEELRKYGYTASDEEREKERERESERVRDEQKGEEQRQQIRVSGGSQKQGNGNSASGSKRKSIFKFDELKSPELKEVPIPVQKIADIPSLSVFFNRSSETSVNQPVVNKHLTDEYLDSVPQRASTLSRDSEIFRQKSSDRLKESQGMNHMSSQRSSQRSSNARNPNQQQSHISNQVVIPEESDPLNEQTLNTNQIMIRISNRSRDHQQVIEISHVYPVPEIEQQQETTEYGQQFNIQQSESMPPSIHSSVRAPVMPSIQVFIEYQIETDLYNKESNEQKSEDTLNVENNLMLSVIRNPSDSLNFPQVSIIQPGTSPTHKISIESSLISLKSNAVELLEISESESNSQKNIQSHNNYSPRLSSSIQPHTPHRPTVIHEGSQRHIEKYNPSPRRLIHPNLNNNGYFALVQLTTESERDFGCKYILTDIVKGVTGPEHIREQDERTAMEIVQTVLIGYCPATQLLAYFVSRESATWQERNREQYTASNSEVSGGERS